MGNLSGQLRKNYPTRLLFAALPCTWPHNLLSRVRVIQWASVVCLTQLQNTDTSVSFSGKVKSSRCNTRVCRRLLGFMLDIFTCQQLLKGPFIFFFPSMRLIFHIPVMTECLCPAPYLVFAGLLGVATCEYAH